MSVTRCPRPIPERPLSQSKGRGSTPCASTITLWLVSQVPSVDICAPGGATPNGRNRKVLEGSDRSVCFAILRRALLVLSLLACVALLIAQLGAYLEFVLVPAPTATTNGPQNSTDLVFGLLAIGGGSLGFLLTVAVGILGLVAAVTQRRYSWVMAICVSGALVLVGLAVSAFVLLGLPRNPYHPFTVLVLLPLTTLAFYLWLQQTSSRVAGGSPKRG